MAASGGIKATPSGALPFGLKDLEDALDGVLSHRLKFLSSGSEIFSVVKMIGGSSEHVPPSDMKQIE